MKNNEPICASDEQRKAWSTAIDGAADCKNSVTTRYDDFRRNCFILRNRDIEVEHGLRKEKYVTGIRPLWGGEAFLSGTMDIWAEDENGDVYRASLSRSDARINQYRMGFYYTDMHILDLNMRCVRQDGSAQHGAHFDFSAGMQGWESNRYVSTKIKNGALSADILENFLYSEAVPAIELKNVGLCLDGIFMIELRMKYTGMSGSGKVFYETEAGSGVSRPFPFETDGAFHVYKVNMLSPMWKGKLKSLRFAFDAVAGSNLTISSITICGDKALPMQLEKVFHVYPDRLYEEILWHCTGNVRIRDAWVEAKIEKEGLAGFLIRDKAGNHAEAEPFDPTTVQWVGFQRKDGSAFGFIFPDVPGNGAVTAESDGETLRLCHHADHKNGGSLREGDRLHIGHRIFADPDGGLEALGRAAEAERHPLGPTAVCVLNSDAETGFEGYDPFRGYYTFTVGDSNFNEAYFEKPQKHPALKVRIDGDGRNRRIFVRTRTKKRSGGLEGAVLLDESDTLLPIPIEVCKNFSCEDEEPFYSPGDTDFSESYFPLSLEKGRSRAFTLLHLYQNWGRYPLKQISSIRYYEPYYHLSTGVTESNCWVPFFTSGRDGFILPDFRTRSGVMWKEQPQFDSVGKNYFFQYIDSSGRFSMMENIDVTIKSAGPAYSDLLLQFVTADGKADVTLRSAEMPQTDENRTFIRMKIDFHGTVDIRNTRDNLSLFKVDSRGQAFRRAGYVNRENCYVTLDLTQDSGDFPLGGRCPYWTLYAADKLPYIGGGTNVGVMVCDADITVGGQPYTDGLAFAAKTAGREFPTNYASLTLQRPDVVFCSGDHIRLNMILLPWGSFGSKSDENMRALRESYGLRSLSLSVREGSIVDGSMIPTVRARKENAEFTLSGGKNHIVFAVTGFFDYCPPAVFKYGDGEWREMDNRVLGYDGYQAFKADDGSFGFAFVDETDGGEQRYRVVCAASGQV